MKLAQVLRPKQPRNLIWAAAAFGLLLLLYLAGSRLWPWSPKRGLGLAFGFVAAAAFLFEMSYPFRRPRARPLATARNWIQVHVYLGLVAFLAVVMHAGFRWPHGTMGWGLLLLSAWVTLTGLLGVMLQKWIPVSLAEGLRVEALYERIPSLVEQLRAEADALLVEASDVLERFYRSEVREAMAGPSASWAFLLSARAGRERALEPFRNLMRFLDPSEQEKAQDLMNIYTEKIELDAHYSLQGILRRWPVLHVPPAGLLLGLMVVHVFTWLWY